MSEPLDEHMAGYEQAKKDFAWLVLVAALAGMMVGIAAALLLGSHDLLTCTTNLKQYSEKVAKFCWCAVKFA